MKILLGIVYCEIPCWTLVFFMYVVRFPCLCTGIERPEVLIKFLSQTISFFGNRFSLNLILPIQIDWLAGKPKIVKIWHDKCVLSVSSFLHECWYPNLCPAPWGTNTAEREYPQSNSHSGWHQLSLLYFHPVCLFFGWHDTWSHTSCFLSRWCLS